MNQQLNQTYDPINRLKRLADDLWIVDGPVIRFGMPWPKMPFPTRMTVIRLADGALFVHSPTPLTDALRSELEGLGSPRWIVGPNRIHYWWIPEWHAAYPEATVYLAPRIREQAGAHISFDTVEISTQQQFPWSSQIETLPVPGDFTTEIVFFHRPSRTLLLTDLIENFERSKLPSAFLRLVTRLGGVQDPDGQMPRDMRLTYRRHSKEMRAAVEQMIGLDPERIILAHGRWYDRDGAAELRRAFRWLLQ